MKFLVFVVHAISSRAILGIKDANHTLNRSCPQLSTVKASPLVHHITKMAKHADIKAATEGKGCTIVFQ